MIWKYGFDISMVVVVDLKRILKSEVTLSGHCAYWVSNKKVWNIDVVSIEN